MDYKYSYKFTEKAEKDLFGILRYIGEDLSNPTAATEFGKKVFERIDDIRNFPQSGTLVENDFLSNKSIRRVVIDNYLLYYAENEVLQTIYIVRIVYGKRNLEEIYRTIKY